MKNWNLIAAMILVALFAVSCGDSDPTTDEGGACTTAGEMKCEGTAILTCTNSVWENTWDCGTNGQTCVQNGTTAACSGTTTDNNNTDNTVNDTDTATGTCGDNVTNGTDVCDGDAKNCVDISASYTGGVAMCKSDCTGFDTSTCQGATDNEVPDTDSTTTGVTCSEINTCAGNCADQACYDACVATGTTEAQGQFTTLMTCISNNCATECGSSGTTESCNTCANDKCADEVAACFTVDAPVYGTMTAAGTTYPFVYDGDSSTSLNDQITANQSGYLQAQVFAGSYAGSKTMPPSGATYDISLAYFTKTFTQGGTTYPNSVTMIEQYVASDQQTMVNPAIQTWINSDTLANGQYTIDNGDAGAVLLNSLDANTSCLLAYAFYGTFNITSSTGMTAAGGSFAFNAAGVKLYYPKETPSGDISGQITSITTCVKE